MLDSRNGYFMGRENFFGGLVQKKSFLKITTTTKPAFSFSSSFVYIVRI